MAVDSAVLDRARQVKKEVEDFLDALLAARDAFAPSARLVEREEAAHDRRMARTPREERTTFRRIDRELDVAVIGFWWPESRHAILVCSQGGLNLIRHIAEHGPQMMRVGNTYKHKEKYRYLWDNFLKHCGSQIQVATSRRELRRTRFEPAAELANVREDMIVLRDQLQQNLQRLLRQPAAAAPDAPAGGQAAEDLHRGAPQVFGDNEAEARMASYLMRHRIAGPVHFYGTWSPCGDCCRSLRWLSYLYGRRRAPGPEPGDPFRWRIGWVLYGEEYEARTNAMDRQALERARDWQGIAGFEVL